MKNSKIQKKNQKKKSKPWERKFDAQEEIEKSEKFMY